MSIKYKTALIIGRFQPFHKGHLFMFREAFGRIEKAIIGIGSVNVHNDDNPFTQSQVERVIDIMISSEGWKERIAQTIGIPDFNNDEKWLDFINKNCKKYDVVVSHNDWVTNIFKKAGTPVIEIPFYRRDIYEGRKIRKLLKSGGDWESLVPKKVSY